MVGMSFRCPWHDDKSPSAGVWRDDGGGWHATCQVCKWTGDVFDVLARARKVPLKKILVEFSNKHGKRSGDISYGGNSSQTVIQDEGTLVAGPMEGTMSPPKRYFYTNPTTGIHDFIEFHQIDSETRKKKVSIGHQIAFEGEIIRKAPAKPWPLFNRVAIRKSDEVLVVEGPKCAKFARKCGVVATTSPCGSGKAKQCDWTPLAGKRVYLWADNDRVGVDHMAEVLTILQDIEPEPEVYVCRHHDLELCKGGDIIDFCGKYRDDLCSSAVRGVIADADPTGGVALLKKHHEAMFSGEYDTADLPFPKLTEGALPLLPGNVMLLCGPPGSRKSMFLMMCLHHWWKMDIKACCYMLEYKAVIHLARLQGILCSESDFNIPKKARARQAEVEAGRKKFAAEINGVYKMLTMAPKEQASLDELIVWIKQKAEAGCRVICIDPVTMATHSGRDVWVADSAFMFEAKDILDKYNCTLLLSTHNKKGGSNEASLDNLAGGAAFGRFNQCTLWMIPMKQKKKVKIFGPCGTYETTINTIIQVTKANMGPAAGRDFGFNWIHDKVNYQEEGMVL